MVQVSTDKAVNPVGMMGVTKRLGELYSQALDLDSAGRDGGARFMTVRFGNVLGSSGSLIPLFQRQLSSHGPLTVTHQAIDRYFMTVQEAVHLILQSSTRALRGGVEIGRASCRERVCQYVYISVFAVSLKKKRQMLHLSSKSYNNTQYN